MAWILVGMVTGCGKQLRVEQDGGDLASGLAQLDLIKGEVLLERGGKRRPASLETLVANDVLESGENGEASLRFRDGRRIEMGSNARLSIHADQNEIVVSISHGLVLSRPSEADGGENGSPIALNILTPFGLTRVGNARNAVSVDIKTDGGTVNVLLGDVEFISKSGQTSRLAAGGKLALGIGSPEVLEIKPQPRTLSVLAIRDRRAVELRPSRHSAWAELPFKPYRLSAGDSIRSRTGTVSLQLEGSRARISGGIETQLDFDGAVQEGNLRQLRIPTLEGGLSISIVDNEKLRLTLDDVEFETQGPTFATIARRNQNLTAEAVAGDVLVRLRSGSEHLIRAGRLWRSSSERGFPESNDSEAPKAALQLPPETGMRIFHPNLSEATLIWPGAGEDSLVEVSSDSRFQALNFTGLVHQPWIRVPIPRRGPLFWRISDPLSTRVLYQGDAIFRQEKIERDLTELRHEVPDGVEQTTIYYQDRPPALTFKFGLYADATAYRLAIYRREELNRPLVERTVEGNFVSLRAGSLGDGAYVWSAIPLGKNNEPLIGGRMNRLEIAYDNSVPSLSVRSPRNGEVAKAIGVLASGVAPVGTQVFIDGHSIPLDRFHRFSLRVAPAGRPPVVVFQLVAPSRPALFIARVLAEPK